MNTLQRRRLLLTKPLGPIVATHLTTASQTANATSTTTASISPTAGRLVLAAIGSAAAGVAVPTVTGNGLTWVQVATITRGSGARLTLFRAMGTPSAGAVTLDFSGVSQSMIEWSISEFAGVNISGTNGSGAIVQSGTASLGSGTSGTVTLAGFTLTPNAAFGVFRHLVNEAASVGAGFTLLGETHHSDNAGVMSEWAGPDSTVNASWATDGGWHAVAVELRAA